MRAEYIDHMGTDLSVVNAARVSFANKSELVFIPPETNAQGQYTRSGGWELAQKDVNLIGYLARGMTRKEWEAALFDLCMHPDSLERTEEVVTELVHMATHWVPFTHTAITLRMKAPIPIRTQCFKSKIGFTESEESRRYISSTPELYVPDSFREHSTNVKQGSGSVHPDSERWLETYKQFGEVAINVYEAMLVDGICEEQARFVLPQGVQVNWIWTGNLAAYARYFNLRYDNHAQKESQVLAEQVANIIEPLFPVSWKALTRSRRT